MPFGPPASANFSDDDFELVPRPSMDADLHDGREFDVLSLGESTILSTDSDSESTPGSPSRAASAVIEALEDLHFDQLSKDMLRDAVASAQASLQGNAAPALVAAAALTNPIQTPDVTPATQLQSAFLSDTAPSSTVEAAVDGPTAAAATAPAVVECHNASSTAPCTPTAAPPRPQSRRPTMLLVVGAYVVVLSTIRYLDSGPAPSTSLQGQYWPKDSQSISISRDSPVGKPLSHTPAHNTAAAQLNSSMTVIEAVHAAIVATCSNSAVGYMDDAATARAATKASFEPARGAGSYSNSAKTAPAVNMMLACPVCRGVVQLNASGTTAPVSKLHDRAPAAAPVAAGRFNPLLGCRVCWETVKDGNKGNTQTSKVDKPLYPLRMGQQPPSTCQAAAASAAVNRAHSNAIAISAAVQVAPQPLAKSAPSNHTAANWLLQYLWPCQAAKQQQQRRQRVRQQQQQSLRQLLQLYPALPASTQLAASNPLPLLSYYTKQQQQRIGLHSSSSSSRLHAVNETAAVAVHGPGGVAAAAAAAVAAVVRRIAQPTKAVPALYIPAPPCLSLGSHKSTPKGLNPSAAQAAADPKAHNPQVPSLNPAGSSVGFSGVTLPMLPPLVYAPPAPPPPPPAVVPAPAANKQAAAAATGLTLPMLPPICSSSGSNGGLALPMLPAVTCSTCSTELQLAGPPSGKWVAPLGSSLAQQEQQQQQQDLLGKQLTGSSGSTAGSALQLPQWAFATIVSAASNSSTISSSSSSSSGSNSSSGDIRVEGWVTTWASFPMLSPQEPAARTVAAAAAATADTFIDSRQGLMVSKSNNKHLFHKVVKSAARMQKPLRSLLQLLATARGRSLQCNLPASNAAFSSSSSSSSKPQQAFVAIDAAATAARKLLGLTKQLQVVASSAAGNSHQAKFSWECSRLSSYQGAESSQEEVQEMCAAVGLAHREVQMKLAATIFKQHAGVKAPGLVRTPSTTAAAAAAAAAAVVPPSSPASSKQHIRGSVYAQYLPLAATQATKSSSGNLPAAAGTTAAVQGPLIPLQQQQGAHSNSIRRHYPANAARLRHSSSAGYDNLLLLNPGWDRGSALAAAIAAGGLSKAEGKLQKACQQFTATRAAATAHGDSSSMVIKEGSAAGDGTPGTPGGAHGYGLGHARVLYYPPRMIEAHPF